ncbi:MAG: DUF1194 domain-containing protein [Alphaproteobacteria bacterium]|nr:DUF1194 domain-containing protein [Alphaproteobacteria bacterium]
MIKFKHIAVAAGAAIMSALGAQQANAAPVAVDLELQLLVDVSNSISTGEFNLQRTGYSNAFRNATIQNQILNGVIGKIAVELIYWSSSNQQNVATGWALIDSVASANAFADAIDATTRPYNGNTGVGEALAFGAPRFDTNDFDGTRQVIDLSGDGQDNSGNVAPATARDAALAAGVDAINALAIGSMSLVDYFNANVIGGTGAFTVFAADFDAFGAAIIEKLGREITPEIPLPGALPLMLTGMALFGWTRRRKSEI